jgi:hypothetical protein
MPNQDEHTRPATVRRAAVAAFSAVVLMVVLLGAVLLSREDDVGTAATTVRQSSADALPSSSTLEVRTEVIQRLKEILQVRDKAFRERDSGILEDVYTVDCPCLEGDRNAIKELTANNYHMVGGTTSVRIRKANRVSARLWLVVADFRSAPLRIEAEDNKLIREEAGGSDLFQFALSKPAGSSEWLLGRAAAYKDSPG